MSVRILTGDCREVLKGLPDESVHSVVTDPPYHLTSIVRRFGSPTAAPAKSNGATGVYARASKGFMGQTWDGGGVAFEPETWAAVGRVLKPGGYLLAFGAPRNYHRLAMAIEDAGFEIRDCCMFLYGCGFPKSHNLHGEWEGWGSSLKPAYEPIVMARKPLVGTIAENVSRYGTGAINVDASRVDLVGVQEHWANYEPSAKIGFGGGEGERIGGAYNSKGRWPANVCHDGSEEVLAAFPPSDGGGDIHRRSSPKTSGVYGAFAGDDDRWAGYGDTGSAARFFYSAKADAKDRAGSNHPTVKPVSLMRWLVRMVTPPGGTCLDPFAGSGTTGQAADQLGFNVILIEQNPEYAATIAERIKADAGLFAEVA